MSDTLEVVESNGRYYIYWVCDGDEGLCVGDGDFAKPSDPADREGLEVYVAHEAVRLASGSSRDGGYPGGFYFERRADAVAALRAAKFAIKNIDIPMPEWAIKAAAAGWKAPKGWKP